jgi:DNA-binding PadR family transcriptional regulator
MSLKHTLLGFLNMWPLSGYDLTKMFAATVRFYWSATHTQIYRTLKQMLEEGLVEQELIRQTDYPNKKVYHITKRGKEELLSWLADPADIPPVRHKLLVKITLGEELATERIAELLEGYRAKLQKRLKLYHTSNEQITRAYARSERERFLWDAVLDNGISVYETELSWIDRTLKGLAKFGPPAQGEE